MSPFLAPSPFGEGWGEVGDERSGGVWGLLDPTPPPYTSSPLPLPDIFLVYLLV